MPPNVSKLYKYVHWSIIASNLAYINTAIQPKFLFIDTKQFLTVCHLQTWSFKVNVLV